VNSILKKVFTRLRLALFPTEHDKEIQRWYSDGGDEGFRYDYDLNGESIVMDLGGYKGQWASDIYARYNCRILIFEPVKPFAEKIKNRFKYNSRVEVFNIALGANSRQGTIALHDDGSSVYRQSTVKETIQFEDVLEFFSHHNIDSIDLMKVNIEGGEYELMPRLFESGIVKRIKNIQIQFHDVEASSETRMKEICYELSKTHRPTYQYKFVWENWVRCEA
jgi:FkbM family methyltransferase